MISLKILPLHRSGHHHYHVFIVVLIIAIVVIINEQRHIVHRKKKKKMEKGKKNNSLSLSLSHRSFISLITMYAYNWALRELSSIKIGDQRVRVSV